MSVVGNACRTEAWERKGICRCAVRHRCCCVNQRHAAASTTHARTHQRHTDATRTQTARAAVVVEF
eukprot:1930522-Rhodomonas_salina.1